MMKRCSKCLLPEAVPGSKIGPDGICGYCHAPGAGQSTVRPNPAHREDLERTLAALRDRQQTQKGYDCLVPLSGGKDSIYLLYKLKIEYGLRVLAYTTNIDLPEVAWSNIRTALARLDIDHVVYNPAPAFTRKLFRYLLQNQEARGAVYTVSYVYAPLFEGDAIRLAIEKDIPLILAGYSPGQPEPERMLYEFSPKLISEEDWTPPHLKECGEFSDEELSRFSIRCSCRRVPSSRATWRPIMRGITTRTRSCARWRNWGWSRKAAMPAPSSATTRSTG